MEQQKFNIPTLFIIFGATGDLAQKKIFPALFDLYTKGLLPDQFFVIAFARRPFEQADFATYVAEIITQHLHTTAQKNDEEAVRGFCDHIDYVRGTFDDEESFLNLAEHLKKRDDDIGQCTNKLFHLAVPPTYYELLLRQLSQSGLTVPCSDDMGWTRVLIEKPFGNDLETAQKLDMLLGTLFKEEQIFRIDHYLAKETVQNILVFRFANILFAPVWDRAYIEKVELRLWETIDVKTRGAFYDGVGALRDVGQNHLLQMLSLIAMEHPGGFDDHSIREARAHVLARLAPVKPGDLMRAQYEGYQETEGVAPDSQTETYFRIKAHINDERWHGVPFILEAGKALAEKKTQIVVTFREPVPCLCQGDRHTQYNKIIFDIQPEEKIRVRFFAKAPGLHLTTMQKDFVFDYAREKTQDIDAYEKVLYDAIIGDQTLFTSTEEVVAAWRFITPLMKQLRDTPLQHYKAGTLPEQ